ncbi:hypothetical protein BJ166DRAFT_195090 [Pestalotiopsis sp. NC0098]|nr:hypothetical protein BJ166DRAFT_195090 [Pestalotiopsis sp. NC0098]
MTTNPASLPTENTLQFERRLAFPLEGLDPTQLQARIDEFMQDAGLKPIDRPYIEQGAFLALDPDCYKTDDASDLERNRTEPSDTQVHDHQPPSRHTRFVTEQGDVIVDQEDYDLLELEKNATMEEINKQLWLFVKMPFTCLFHRDREDGSSSDDSNAVMMPWQAYPPYFYWLVTLCCLSAVVQGFDETVINGAQTSLKAAFPDIIGKEAIAKSSEDDKTAVLLLGLFNGAPYIVSAVACLLTHWLNRLPFFINGKLGRRGVISAACLVSFASCLAQGLVGNNFYAVLASRLVLGLGIGPKSATVPIFASECAPSRLRGAAVTLWQMWTAFGLMCGFAASLIFWSSVDAWRWMLGSPCIFPLIPMFAIWAMPESPRFLLQCAKECPPTPTGKRERAKYIKKARESLRKLNRTQIQADRELFSLYASLKLEPDQSWSKILVNPLKEQRTRRALMASTWTMLLQQLCGVNVLAYYSSTIISQFGSEDKQNMLPIKISFGLGAVNFLFAIPAFLLIDPFGRRSLLLLAFPILGAFQSAIAGGVWHAHGTISSIIDVSPAADGSNDLADSTSSQSSNDNGLIAALVFMFLFFATYSFSVGPVPFTYASESMPLHHRDQGKSSRDLRASIQRTNDVLGMGYATFVNWTFNFLLAFLWPIMSTELNPWGGFLFYSGMCFAGWLITLW